MLMILSRGNCKGNSSRFSKIMMLVAILISTPAYANSPLSYHTNETLSNSHATIYVESTTKLHLFVGEQHVGTIQNPNLTTLDPLISARPKSCDSPLCPGKTPMKVGSYFVVPTDEWVALSYPDLTIMRHSLNQTIPKNHTTVYIDRKQNINLYVWDQKVGSIKNPALSTIDLLHPLLIYRCLGPFCPGKAPLEHDDGMVNAKKEWVILGDPHLTILREPPSK